MGILFLVSTPIGNLEDITLRALKTLFNVEVIACEDTRKLGQLLNLYKTSERFTSISRLMDTTCTKKPNLISLYEENEIKRIPEIINYLREGKNVALVSNAGTPTISDPGYKLVRECIDENILVESIPGPSSVLTALTISGLPTDKFLFLGFLPKKQSKRLKLLKNYTLTPIPCTLIFFESPFRLLKTLEELKELFGDIEIVICRELTKIYEEIRREKISVSINHFIKVKPKGEFTLLFNIPLK